jgi:K+-sensing histidine kinase KdpD
VHRLRPHKLDLLIAFGAFSAPLILTALLLPLRNQQQRYYVFLYLGLVAVLATVWGLWPALISAAVTFVCVDYFFVPPYGTLSIANPPDLVNLVVFFGAAGLVGAVASRRRREQLRAEALARALGEANQELVRLNQEQAETAQAQLRLARSEERVQSLQESERIRRELLANISHDLRTPIGTILTETTNLIAVQAIRDGLRPRLEIVAGEARRLASMVSDMLDLSRIDVAAIDLDLEPIAINDAIAAAVERLQVISPQRRVVWDADGAAVDVSADWRRLGQIFDNLLANAERSAPADTAIEIEVTAGDGEATVRVIDHGHGVPEELRDRIFDRFVQGSVSDGAGHRRGTGLGLAIVRGLVEAHGGTATLEPQGANVGAVFQFTLRLAQVAVGPVSP